MNMKEMLLQAPDGHLDPSMFPYIEQWSDEPTALQILEVLDKCVFAALASGFVIQVLETMLDTAMRAENTTHEELVKKASWRKQH